MNKVFLSYAHEDQGEVETLYRRLHDMGFAAWMDKFDLLGGQLWEPALEKAIKASDFFITCLSKRSVTKRGMVQRELSQALKIAQGMLRDDIYIIPLRLDACDVMEDLKAHHWVDYFETTTGWSRLLKALRAGIQLRHGAGAIPPELERAAPLGELDFLFPTEIRFAQGVLTLFKGVRAGTFWHENDPLKSGFSARSPGAPATITGMADLIMSPSASPFISLTRSFDVAKGYAQAIAPMGPGYVYEIQVLGSAEPAFHLFDPVKEIARILPSRVDPNYDPESERIEMSKYFFPRASYAASSGTPMVRSTPYAAAMFFTFRDAEVHALGQIPPSAVVKRHIIE